jgi:8-hydroxy-5-deazaflavin:NADPH oxidoreductase
MKYSAKSKIAIIGYGNIAEVVAADLAKNNRPVIIAGREFNKTKTLAEKIGRLAKPMEIGPAIQEADIIVLAIWFDAIKPFFYQYEDLLRGKMIIDPSNPIAPDGKGGFVKTIAQNESAGTLNAALLPENAKFVKALGTLGSASLAEAANQIPEKAVLFYATDDSDANADIEELILDMGFDPVRVGEIDQSIRLEVFGDLHQFGALGKTITASEANKLYPDLQPVELAQ